MSEVVGWLDEDEGERKPLGIKHGENEWAGTKTRMITRGNERRLEEERDEEEDDNKADKSRVWRRGKETQRK